jgi:branched-chain amino acid transport system ATP-binding protein
MLVIKDLNVYYDAIHALKGVDFRIDEGEIVALIGANGAGKSTTLNAISGIQRARSGQIIFMDEDITQLPAPKIVRKGIVQVPEGRKIFATLTVMENLGMGAFIFNNRVQFQKDLEMIYTQFPRLKERINQLGGTLSGGEQQMLAIARGLMAHPRLLLLDEPSMGLAPILVEQIFDIIQDINKQGTSILLVEQNAQMALSISQRAYVLETGSIVLEGSSSDIIANPQVQAAYLGI